MKFPYGKKIPIVVFFFLGVSFLLFENKNLEVKSMDLKASNLPLKSICIGRFILDVPSQVVVNYRPSMVSGWTITTKTNQSEEDFHLSMNSKEKILNNEKNERGAASLEMVKDFKNEDLYAKIFLFGRMWIPVMTSGKDVISEVVSIDAVARSKGISYEFNAEFRSPSDVDELVKILSQMRALPNSEPSSEKGFCFDHGIILDPLLASQREYTGVFMGVREKPDLAINFSTSAGLKNGKTLLQRNSDNSVQADYRSNFNNLRTGPRSINGIPGEEVLHRVSELNGSVVHGFMWESIGTQHDIYLPSISMELETGIGRPGKPVDSSLSDREAIVLWNQISSSLRLRPVNRKSEPKGM